MPNSDDLEAICLEIMETDDMMSVGNWEEPIKALVRKGYAKHVTGKFYGITPEGLKALDALEKDQTKTIEGEAEEVAE